MPGTNALEIAKVMAKACNGDEGVDTVSIYQPTEEGPITYNINGKTHDTKI